MTKWISDSNVSVTVFRALSMLTFSSEMVILALFCRKCFLVVRAAVGCYKYVLSIIWYLYL